MLLARLKDETRDLHERVERTLGILDRVPAADEYRALLRRFHGFYAPVEGRVAALPWATLGFDWAARCKLPALAADLAALGDDAAARAGLPVCTALPPLGAVAEALGCLYVLEGATLGGQIIARHLRAAPGEPLPTAFFAGYGPQVGRRWQEFRAFLTAQADGGGADAETVVRAARATFDTLGAWLAAGAEPPQEFP